MKLEGVIVCKDYADFLAEALPTNMQYFDRLVVVTHPGDRATRDLCQKYTVDCVVTECMHDNGDAFNKGRAIQLGLGHLRGLDWIIHLDADIVLPHNFRGLLDRARLVKGNIYGADRVNVYGFDHWRANKGDLTPHYTHGYFVEPHRAFPVGARIIHKEHGYTPIGYFQLWHATEKKAYPINQGNAEHTDVLFSAQWPREKRVLLPEVVVYHLESNLGPSKMGVNWNGRKSPPFAPASDEVKQAFYRHAPPDSIHCRNRSHCRWPHCFCPPKPHPYHFEKQK